MNSGFIIPPAVAGSKASSPRTSSASCPGSFLIERRDDPLAFRRRQVFHYFRQVCRMQILELFMRDTQLYSPQRVRLDQVHELPSDGSLWKLALQFADHAR